MNKYKVYPKQFRNEKISIEKNRCFFIMPFSEEFDIIYGEIKASLSKEHFHCIRVDEIPGSLPVINKILTEILKSQFIIVDLTNCNPNVFYELGIAHTFKDAENIFLLKEKGSKVPFDITHLTYLEYDKDNMYHLTAKLKKAIANNKYVSDFYEVLNIHGIIQYIHDNQEEFIEIIKEFLEDDMILATELLNYSHKELNEKEVQDFIKRFELKLKNCITLYESSIVMGIVDFYAELLLVCDSYVFTQEHLQLFLTDYFSTTNLSKTDIIVFETHMALKFAYAGKQLNIVMPWIISYFKRSKSGTIDLNRYKLESFLLTTQSKIVNDDICNAISHPDAHIREHLADIIGEKRLMIANNILCKQLLCEKNYYTASSIIRAIGKIGCIESLEYINKWIFENECEIIATKHFFIFKHIRFAISCLDTNYLVEFEKKYNIYLQDYIF